MPIRYKLEWHGYYEAESVSKTSLMLMKSKFEKEDVEYIYGFESMQSCIWIEHMVYTKFYELFDDNPLVMLLWMKMIWMEHKHEYNWADPWSLV